MVHYLLVDDRDGSVLAEIASARQALQLLSRLGGDPHEAPPISVVRLQHEQGDLSDVSSIVSARPLQPLMQRRARTSPDRPNDARSAAGPRPSRRPPSTQPPPS
jgi:hypothetical protein